jgi:hypothetical protein
MAIDAALRRFVRERAENRCEYCHCHQEDLPFVTFHVEHVIARQHGGNDHEMNLCLSCHWCNYQKGMNIATQVDGQLVPLFNPRVHDWDEHFTVDGDRIDGLTAIGRGTVRLLDMNDPDRRELRSNAQE